VISRSREVAGLSNFSNIELLETIMLGFLKSIDIHCTVAAALFVLGSFLAFVYGVALRNHIVDDEKENDLPDGEIGDMEATRLINVWHARFDLQGLLATSVFINACAWVVFSIVIIKLTWVLSSKGKYSLGSTVTIAVLAVGGAVAEFLASLLFLGANRAMINIANRFELDTWIMLAGSGFEDSDFGSSSTNDSANGPSSTNNDPVVEPPQSNGTATVPNTPINATAPTNGTGSDIGGDRLLENNFDTDQNNEDDDKDNFYIDGDESNKQYDGDGLGWKTLELLRAVSDGMVSFIDAIEYLFISAILFMTFFAVLRKGRGVFSLWWAVFGLLVAVVSLAQFLTTALSFDATSPLRSFSNALVFINQVFLLPIWLIWLGRQLKEAQAATVDETEDKETGALS
jgi:hypothetical protein